MTNLRIFHNEKTPEVLLVSILVNKVLTNKQKAHIAVESQEIAEKLDKTLWTINSTGFIPHCLVNHQHATSTPIVISTAEQISVVPPIRDMLITLDGIAPEIVSSFTNFVAIIPEQLDKHVPLTKLIGTMKDRGHECQVFDRLQN